jgi:hypothetical protein
MCVQTLQKAQHRLKVDRHAGNVNQPACVRSVCGNQIGPPIVTTPSAFEWTDKIVSGQHAQQQRITSALNVRSLTKLGQKHI